MRTGSLNVTLEEKAIIAQALLEQASNGVLLKGCITDLASALGYSRKTIGRIWAATKAQMSEEGLVSFEPTVRKKRSNTITVDGERLKAIPLQKRCTYRSIAREMKVSKSLVAEWYKHGMIRAHTNAVKPELTSQNKLTRLAYCLSCLKYDSILNKVMYKDMQNMIHIDEKWFYITRSSERYYLMPNEAEPHRSCKSKRFITKLMFICAVARPQYASNGECIFDGKIGIFPFTKREAALRNSKNWIKGTIETKTVSVINKVVTKEKLISKVIPAIKTKWPLNANKDIFIQQDNAKPHIKNSDIEFRAAASSDGFNINLVCQPSNSPDTNINDLGFFRAIQSLQYETAAYTVDELVTNVINAYDNLSHVTLNKVFLSSQACMTEIMLCKGHNTYKLPHMGKDALINEGLLPQSIEVDLDLVKGCIDYLRLPENAQTKEHFDVDSLCSDMGY